MSKMIATAAALTVIGGCSEVTPPQPVEPPVPPGAPLASAVLFRGTINAEAGTLTFEPVHPSARASGPVHLWPAIYGNQGVTVRLYNSAVTTAPGGPGKKIYSANVGVRNLLSHSIGDEQAGLIPRDTMGVFVFFASEPVVIGTSPSCPACTVVVQNHAGSIFFTQLNQKYFHWPERLAPAGQLGDTTRVRRTWSFLADSAVTDFQFDVLVSAAWPPPAESRWRIEYTGDSLPELGTEPGWRKDSSGTNPGTVTASGGALTVAPRPNSEIGYSRQDSIAATSLAYIEGRIAASATNSGRAEARMSINDGTKVVALGLASDRVGFVDNNNMFIGSPFFVTTNVFRIYRIAMFRTDSATFFVDGVRRGSTTYSSFSNNPVGPLAPRFRFGAQSAQGASKADVDYVIYEIGATAP